MHVIQWHASRGSHVLAGVSINRNTEGKLAPLALLELLSFTLSSATATLKANSHACTSMADGDIEFTINRDVMIDGTLLFSL
jgi:hypothetical protein